MKRYYICLGDDGIESEDGQWIPASVAQALYDALRAQIYLSESWIDSYIAMSEALHGPMSDNDYKIWRATGHQSKAMTESRKALSLADGEE